METTFSWNMLSGGGRGGGMCGDAPAFVTANGRAVSWNKKHAPASCAGAFDGNNDGTCNDNGGDGGGVSAVPSQTHGKPFLNTTTTTAGLCTPGPTGVDAETGGGTNGGCGGRGREGEDVRRGSTPAPVVTPHTMSAPPCHPGTPSSGSVSLATGEGRRADPRAASPETRAAQAAAQASLSVIRKSIIRRRGGMPNRAPPPPPVVGQDETGAAAAGAEAGPLSDTRLCATPFVIRRPPSSSSSVPRPASTPGAGAKGGPLDLTRAGADGSGGRDIGHGEALTEKEPGSAPDTPVAAGRGNPAAQLVTPATGDMAGRGAATGVAAKTGAAAGLKRRRASNPRGGLSGKAPKKGKGGAVAGGPAAAESGGKEGRPRAGIPPCDAGGSKKPSEAALVDGDGAAPTAAEATAAAGVAVAAAAAEPPSAPTKIVVTFSAAGSLGMGVAKDVTEEGSVILAGKAPTSAAAVVPNGWRLTEVDGKSARGLGGRWAGRGVCECG